MGGAHSRVEASITSPTSAPYLAKQLSALFHTQTLQLSSLLQRANNDILRILPAQHSNHRAKVTYWAWHTIARPGPTR